MSRLLSSSTAGHTAEAEAPTGVSGKPEVSSNGAGRKAAVLTFQEAIARLQSYWASVGCAVWQPFNSEVGLPSDNPRPWLASFQICAILKACHGIEQLCLEVHGSSARGTHIFVRSRPVREHSDGPGKIYRRMASPLDSCNRLLQQQVSAAAAFCHDAGFLWSAPGLEHMVTMVQVGAGTMNPATFLRVLGPEKWSVCYVEPSVRPDDSRYGENPNRLQQHTQFQVPLQACACPEIAP